MNASAYPRPHFAPLLSSTLVMSLALCACDPGSVEVEVEAEAERVADEIQVDEIVLLGVEEDASPELDPEEIVEDIPDMTLSLEGGSTLSFFFDDGGGVAMLEDVPADAGVASVLDDPRLADASPAVVWYALTGDDVMPEPLRAHHEGLAELGELAPLEQALAESPRDFTPTPLASGSPCLNSTFSTNHCAHPDYADDLCIFNWSSTNSLTWNVSHAHRYKAGFCLQAGQARSWLYYRDEAPSCTYWYTTTFAWGVNSYLHGDRYSTTTYRNYVWWAGSIGGRRIYHHFADGDPGAVFDFGNRWSTRGCDFDPI